MGEIKLKINIAIGDVFNRWTVTSPVFHNSGHCSVWCRCQCGTERIVIIRNLRENRSKSCGCFSFEQFKKRSVHHGKTRTKIYRAWRNILTRCYYKNSNQFSNYGGRGITVCERWMKFENFYADMGDPPSDKHQIDRIDVDGNYCPENCRWLTQKEQLKNKTNTVHIIIDGQKVGLLDECERRGFNSRQIENLRRRIYRGWDPKEALLAKFNERRAGKVAGRRKDSL